MKLTFRAQAFLVLLFLIICVIFFFIFQGVEPYYFSGTPPLHTIDLHIKCVGLKGLFDWGYLSRVRHAYDPDRYRCTYYLIDLAFLLVYTFLFFLLSYKFWRKSWIRWIFCVYLVGMLADFIENSAFLYYLKRANESLAIVSSYCTTIKSFIFPLNLIVSFGLYISGIVDYCNDKPIEE